MVPEKISLMQTEKELSLVLAISRYSLWLVNLEEKCSQNGKICNFAKIWWHFSLDVSVSVKNNYLFIHNVKLK